MKSSIGARHLAPLFWTALFVIAPPWAVLAQECPEFVSSFNTPGYSYEVKMSRSHAYLTVDLTGLTTGSLRVIEMSDASAPVEVGFFETPGRVFGVTIAGDYAIVSDHDTGIFILDVSSPENPTQVGFINIPYSWNVAVSGNYGFVAADTAGLRVVDISDPHNPVQVGAVGLSVDAIDVAVSGDYAYIVGGWESGLRVIDVTDPSSPFEVGSFNIPGAYAADVSVSGIYAYVAADWAGVYVLDVSEPSAPAQVNVIDTPGFANGVDVAWNLLYVADWDALRVIDVTDPSSPFEVGFHNVPGECRHVSASERYALTADFDAGMSVFRCTVFADSFESGDTSAWSSTVP